jgi:hypothetical protein
MVSIRMIWMISKSFMADIHDRVRRPRRGPMGEGRLKNRRQYETLGEFQASNPAQILEQMSAMSRTVQVRKGAYLLDSPQEDFLVLI